MGFEVRGVEGIPCEVRSPDDVAAMLLTRREMLSGAVEGLFRLWVRFGVGVGQSMGYQSNRGVRRRSAVCQVNQIAG